MYVIDVNNVSQALPAAIDYLQRYGQRRDSRNGPVLVAPGPVTTVYRRPLERVLLYPERDANPFFHMYEAMWMLAGRNDVAGPTTILKSFAQFSDDGLTFHGAYGCRWRQHFDLGKDWLSNRDQLRVIIGALSRNPDDRRCVLQMWDPVVDLGRNGKDVPCNQSAVFSINANGQLDMTVFCRSNDIVWGCYGANAVHFSYLLEYMATAIGCEVGTYTQVSVNWHAYQNAQWERMQSLTSRIHNPYKGENAIQHVPMPSDVAVVDRMVAAILTRCDRIDQQLTDWNDDSWVYEKDDPAFHGYEHDPWYNLMDGMMYAHAIYRNGNDPEDIHGAFDAVSGDMDWGVACQQWLYRRAQKKQERANV